MLAYPAVLWGCGRFGALACWRGRDGFNLDLKGCKLEAREVGHGVLFKGGTAWHLLFILGGWLCLLVLFKTWECEICF